MSDGKTTRTVSIDVENDRWLQEKDNISAYVNRLLKHARKTGDVQTAQIKLQKKQTKRELEEARDRVERLQRDLSELAEFQQQLSQQESAELQEARENLSEVPHEPTNPAVKNWADKLGMTPDELLQQL